MKTLLAFMLPAFAMLPAFGHANICDRTPQVRDQIMQALEADDCAAVGSQELASVVNLNGKQITTLKAGDFDNLTRLQQLELAGNQLTSLPAGVFDSLANLQYLDLWGNLTALPDGVFDGLTSLEELHLTNNRLSALPAGVFDRLTNLQLLHLQGNQLTALPAGVFNGLTSLQDLWLNGNQLTALPDGVFDRLTRLQYLNLERNQLTALPDGVFDRLTNLQTLSLWNNQLTALPAGVFDRLTSLRILSLRDNQLTALPDGVFDRLTRLQYLSLENNHLVGLSGNDPLFAQLPNSVDLDLSGQTEAPTVNFCNRTPQVRDEIMLAIGANDCAAVTAGQLAAVEGLCFSKLDESDWGRYCRSSYSRAPLVALNPGDFAGMTSLEELHLGNNRLTSLPADLFDSLARLNSLNLDHNRLTALPAGAFDSLARLGFLELDNNQLSELPAGVFDGPTRLAVLSLHGNQLTALPAGLFDGLTSLGQISLDHNGLTALPDGVFDGLADLQLLHLNDNQLAALPAGAFDGLTSLEDLSLADNRLTALPAGAFATLTSLQYLWLNGNQLAALPAGVFDGLASLQLLHLHNNALNLLGNRLTALPAGVFDSLTSLQELDLSYNWLTALPAGVFDSLTGLQTLDLSVNQLAELPAGAFDRLTGLQLLYLNDNQLAMLPAGAFDGMTSLRGLYLHRNQLTALPAGLFDRLTNLQGLSLLGNRLTALPAGVFDSLTSLHWLQLNGNHLVGLTENDPLFAQLPNSVDLDLSGQTEAPESPETQIANATRLAAVPLLVSATDSMRQGFVRIINESDQSGSVRITAYDDAGNAANPIEIDLGANQVLHFNAGDLENGNANKGINAGVGSPSRGDWRLAVESALDLRVLSFVRTNDGFLTAMHDVLQRGTLDDPLEPILWVPTFNPASNTVSVSKLRLVNTSDAADIFIFGVDDQGNLGNEGGVFLTLATGEARTLSAQDLESGAQGLTGTLGDGAGKWRLISFGALHSIVGVSLLDSASGHLSSISTENSASTSVPLLVSATDSMRQGFVRIINESDQAGSVRITAYDDAGTAASPIEVQLGARQVLHFNAGDLENGNANKGINAGVGSPSRGDWRLAVESALNTFVFPYVRTGDGFLTAMHDVLPRDGEGRLAAYTFNPGQNRSQVSSLRLVNIGANAESVSIEGVDDQGASAGPVRLTLNAGEARTLSAQDLEGGAQGLTGRLGDGAGKWRLFITAGDSVEGMSLLESPTGHLTNLSTMGFAIEGR